MRKILYGMIVLSLLVGKVADAEARVSIGISLPNVSIGINLPLYPQLVAVPGYPVYYAPGVDANYFFYDGMYWVYQDDNWYASSWYNGPWGFVEPQAVPLFVLRVPVRYYRQPPQYFRGWQSNAPPRWGQHWGREWQQQHRGWDRWNRASTPRRAPLPTYQRHYSGDHYPRAEQQHTLRNQSYRYQPRDRAVRRHLQRQGAQADPRARSTQPHGESDQRSAPTHVAPQQRPSAPQEQRRQPPRVQEREQRSHDRGESRDSGRGQGQEKDDERGRGHNR
ncbi:MAG: hypothetical protein PHP95_06190 [Desulfuromonadaceae bacterium]|nr:hypothetical protein [Desulfuromonadaceae bacterium]MDD2848029.1 hypothetical protein [Desulfuromonadaceae bacterium]MDD4131229.1 hypothetical protein [Desulfuromonadaceae bacterium]